MKILVDQLPNRPIDCVFCRYGMNNIMAECKLEVEGVKCHMEFGINCNKITTLSELAKSEIDKTEKG